MTPTGHFSVPLPGQLASDPEKRSKDDQTTVQSVQVTDHGRRLASAEVSTSLNPHGTAHVCFRAESGHLPSGTRSSLVDAVLALPDVRDSDHLQASVPIGDAESIIRLAERTTDMRAHPAGCTALIEAELTEPGSCPPFS
jgi:hypothetical protein